MSNSNKINYLLLKQYDNIEGCFEPTATGIKLRRKEFNRRIKELVLCIEKHLSNIPEKEVTTEQLFYSNL
jgi:hypothetical protein